MSTVVIRLDDVWKAYGSVPAVCGLALEVPAQSVYGFLGPNGVGKTTTIRWSLGRQKADHGGVALFGHPIDGARKGLLKRVGAIVESPCSYPHLTARENLEVHRRILGLPRTTIAHVLSMVALAPVADRQV